MQYSNEEKGMWQCPLRQEDWRQSGKTAWTYAKENGINPQTFCGWVKREKRAASGFVEIPKQLKPKLEGLQEILIEKGNVKIHIPLTVYIEYPGTIMDVLKAAQ